MVYKPESLRLSVEKLKEYARDLDAAGQVSLEGYLADRQKQYLIERILFLLCEGVIDFLDHVLSSRFQVVSESYEGIIENAFKRGLIPDALFRDLKGLGGFRNILAHGYLTIDHAENHRNLVKMRRIMPAIITELERMIEGA